MTLAAWGKGTYMAAQHNACTREVVKRRAKNKIAFLFQTAVIYSA